MNTMVNLVFKICIVLFILESISTQHINNKILNSDVKNKVFNGVLEVNQPDGFAYDNYEQNNNKNDTNILGNNNDTQDPNEETDLGDNTSVLSIVIFCVIAAIIMLVICIVMKQSLFKRDDHLYYLNNNASLNDNQDRTMNSLDSHNRNIQETVFGSKRDLHNYCKDFVCYSYQKENNNSIKTECEHQKNKFTINIDPNKVFCQNCCKVSTPTCPVRFYCNLNFRIKKNKFHYSKIIQG